MKNSNTASKAEVSRYMSGNRRHYNPIKDHQSADTLLKLHQLRESL